MNRRKKVNQILKKRAKKQTAGQLPKQKSSYIAKANRVPNAELSNAIDSNTVYPVANEPDNNV
ncbi:DUF2986 domain-containing protein [Marinagarivorans algicola]|uniref:DUF2986 domain-containing protein n=1 Tax=Marinagarivorans algicola TaxID=1513270 RepID=UPI0012E21E65|nr:DUF2986 domain-containing protein [Marinagarivorans algicola]